MTTIADLLDLSEIQRGPCQWALERALPNFTDAGIIHVLFSSDDITVALAQAFTAITVADGMIAERQKELGLPSDKLWTDLSDDEVKKFSSISEDLLDELQYLIKRGVTRLNTELEFKIDIPFEWPEVFNPDANRGPEWTHRLERIPAFSGVLGTLEDLSTVSGRPSSNLIRHILFEITWVTVFMRAYSIHDELHDQLNRLSERNK